MSAAGPPRGANPAPLGTAQRREQQARGCHTKRLPVRLALLTLVWFAPVAHADPDDYVATPAVEYGEREIELRLGTAAASDANRHAAASLAFGYGVTPWWFTEIYGKWNRGGATRFDAFEWENRFQLTEPGQYFADLDLLVEIERPRNRADGDELRLGPLLQKDFGTMQANVNVLLERHYRSAAPEVTELGYQWQLKYRWRPAFEFGAQGLGEVGQWNDWATGHEQQHVVGPAIFGKFNLGGRQALKYDAALLFKASGAAPARTLRAQLEYAF